MDFGGAEELARVKEALRFLGRMLLVAHALVVLEIARGACSGVGTVGGGGGRSHDR